MGVSCEDGLRERRKREVEILRAKRGKRRRRKKRR